MSQSKTKRTRADWAILGRDILVKDNPPLDLKSLNDLSVLTAEALLAIGPTALTGMLATAYEAGRRDAMAEAGKVIANVDEKLEKIG